MTERIEKSFWYSFLRLRRKQIQLSTDELIGECLVKQGLLSKNALYQVIETQKEHLFLQGKAVPLTQVIIEQGNISEKEIVKALNDYYHISISSLSENLKVHTKKTRGFLTEDIPAPRIPIWLQISIATMFVMALSIGILSYVIMERQKEKLYEHTVKLGMVSLNYFGNNAKIPLLKDDTLALNTLINQATNVEGHFYSFIINNDEVIKAHTDHEKIDKEFIPFRNVEKTFQKENVTYFNYILGGSTHVLNLSMPILFKDKKLGEVHVGLSIDFIQKLFLNERAFLAYTTLIMIFLGMVIAVIVSLRFSRPISTLVNATKQIAKGNYEYKVDLKRNDELGTLGEAFNRMGRELFRQSLMKESFGKYVGPEVLDMIMRSPAKGWLKGRKNEASILFADIRGFTAYSEAKEPEEIVEKLNEFFSIATEVIQKHGGYIDKFIGDSVLAIFGVPVSQKDHNKRCICAAIDMQQELLHASKRGNPLLASVGIGIASGVVVAGNIGSQAKMEYTVIGDSVNVASYINSLAGAGEILIGNGQENHLDDFNYAESLEPQKIKGREELVNIYRVTGNKNRVRN